MKKALKLILKIIWGIPIVLILVINFKLYYHPEFSESNGYSHNEDVLAQLRHLKKEHRNGAGEKMQQLFPEGFIFFNALYGLSWCGFLENTDPKSTLFKEGIEEINQAISDIESPSGTQIFQKELPLEYGAFYTGWSSYLIANKLKLLGVSSIDSSDAKKLKSKCSSICKAVTESKLPYLESYSGQIWPADVMSCVATLKIHDEIFGETYQNEINDWIAQVKVNLDHKTGLISHSFSAEYKTTFEGARGCSQSLIQCFLAEIDTGFSKDQFEIYQELFVTSRLGLSAVSEYPLNTKGVGDVDSGPVIWGIGGAASIVGQRAHGKHFKWTTYKELRNCIEAFGFGWKKGKEKQYVFGELAMADAFIAWSNSIETSMNQVDSSWFWRFPFQLISLFILLLFGYLIAIV